MHLISNRSTDLADGVQEVNARHPFFSGKLDFPSKVVDVSEQGSEDLAIPGSDIGTHGINDMLGEVGIELDLGLVCVCGRHVD